MRELNRILVPIDFSEASRGALKDALELAAKFGCEVIVLHVWQPPRMLGPDTIYFPPEGTRESVIKVVEAEARKRTEEFVAKTGSEIDVRIVVESGIPTSTILDLAESEDVDLIVLSTHGRSGLSRFFMGSVSEKVVRYAHCPVLTIRSKGRG